MDEEIKIPESGKDINKENCINLNDNQQNPINLEVTKRENPSGHYIDKNLINDDKTKNLKELKKPPKYRALQYYKFLFYSIKMEVKMVEFLNLIGYLNQSEVCVWLFSFIFREVSENYKLVWFHILHLIRGLVGCCLLLKFPKSSDLLDFVKQNNPDIENLLFNDLIRKNANVYIIEPLFKMKHWFIIYIILTIINFVIDAFDFIGQISMFDYEFYDTNKKIDNFISFSVALVYLVLDTAYIFWVHSLKYHFPLYIYASLNSLFNGFILFLKRSFRLDKKPTNLKDNNTNLTGEILNKDKNNELIINLNKDEANNNIQVIPSHKTANTISKSVPIYEFKEIKNFTKNNNSKKIEYEKAVNK